ncbi:hypothetical protein ES703_51945 [subsurface metagenome]
MKTVSLSRFLRGTTDPKYGMPGCANLDHHYGGCLFARKCLVIQGKRCSYFEKSVLPTAMDLGLSDIYEAYERLTGAPPLHRLQARVCPDCGHPLKAHHRFCEKCARNRRRAAYRRQRDN